MVNAASKRPGSRCLDDDAIDDDGMQRQRPAERQERDLDDDDASVGME